MDRFVQRFDIIQLFIHFGLTSLQFQTPKISVFFAVWNEAICLSSSKTILNLRNYCFRNRNKFKEILFSEWETFFFLLFTNRRNNSETICSVQVELFTSKYNILSVLSLSHEFSHIPYSFRIENVPFFFFQF